MKYLKFYGVCMLFAINLVQCTNSSEPVIESNSPSDHTINNGGFMHKSGLSEPLTNCVSCHGSDLRGGDVGLSCYTCHGKKWK